MRRRVLILSGPTHEYIDPVRFIGNASSGLMGKAIAEEAVHRNYEVCFISGPVAACNLPNLGTAGAVYPVVSADDMLQKAASLFKSSDVIIFAAAVADYTPVEKKTEKMAKSADDLHLTLRATPDIARTLCADKDPHQTAIGFALQTSDGETNARRKLTEKKLDAVILNSPATLGSQTGTFSFLTTGNDDFEQWGSIEKSDCATRIFQALEKRFADPE